MTDQLPITNYQSLETLIGLVSHYSPSGDERGAVEWLVARMKSLGFDDAFVDNAGNAVGVIGQGARQVVLLGHIDTVPGEIPVQIVGADGHPPLLYGRGSVDAKGPLACFVDAVAKVGAIDGWQFVVIGTVEEERDSDGARFVATQYKPEFAIIGEPNQWDRVALGYKGSAWANITVKCGQVHSASGKQTACEAAVAIWQLIQTRAESFNAEKKRVFDQVLPTLRGMESGMDENEQWATVKIGVRLPLEIRPQAWYQILNEVCQPNEDVQISIMKIGYPIPAWVCEKNTKLVRSLLGGIRSEGGEPRFVYKTGTADLNIVAPVWQCPAAVYGPGDSGLDHTPNEHIDLSDYEKAVNVLSAALTNLTK